MDDPGTINNLNQPTEDVVNEISFIKEGVLFLEMFVSKEHRVDVFSSICEVWCSFSTQFEVFRFFQVAIRLGECLK